MQHIYKFKKHANPTHKTDPFPKNKQPNCETEQKPHTYIIHHKVFEGEMSLSFLNRTEGGIDVGHGGIKNNRDVHHGNFG